MYQLQANSFKHSQIKSTMVVKDKMKNTMWHTVQVRSHLHNKDSKKDFVKEVNQQVMDKLQMEGHKKQKPVREHLTSIQLIILVASRVKVKDLRKCQH